MSKDICRAMLSRHGARRSVGVMRFGYVSVEGGGMSSLERAILLATRAHAGQLDKGGADYILHPLRVMARVSTHGAGVDP